MKKFFCCIIIILSMFTMMACQQTNIKRYTDNTNPEPIKNAVENTGVDSDPDINASVDSAAGIGLETDYSNVVASTELESYPFNTNRIVVCVRNMNIGKGFYLYSVPFVEQYKDSEWIRLDYQPPELGTFHQCLCALESNTTKPQETYLDFKPKYVTSKLEPGDYRLVVFAGDKVIYAPFKFTK